MRTARSAPFNGWIRPANNTTPSSGAMPSRRRANIAVVRTEALVVDTRRQHLDATRVGAVARDEVAFLELSRREHEVTAPHDVALELGAIVFRASRAVDDPRRCLHERQRVERADERKAELVFQTVRDRARHPVMAVQDVVARILLVDHRAQAPRTRRDVPRAAPSRSVRAVRRRDAAPAARVRPRSRRARSRCGV